MVRAKKLKATTTTTRSNVSKQKRTVDPFQPLPHKLENFCSALDKNRVYVFHVDQTSKKLKRRVFLVPVWMNIFFTLGLLARLYYAVPFYFSFTKSWFTEENPWIQADRLPWVEFLSLVISRVAMVAFDMFLSTKVLSWPVAFCFAPPASPVNWRRAVGFQDKEIIVRKSRSFHLDFEVPWTTDDLLTVKIFASEALDRQTLQKTAYTMIADKRWDLDFASMIEAHDVVAQSKDLSTSDMDRIVLAYSFKATQWQIWYLDGAPQQPPDPDPEPDNATRLKKYLSGKNKEDLFYRYIELIQYETSLPNAETPAQKQAMIQQIKDEFTKAQLNFESVAEELGGIQNMPGLEQGPLS